MRRSVHLHYINIFLTKFPKFYGKSNNFAHALTVVAGVLFSGDLWRRLVQTCILTIQCSMLYICFPVTWMRSAAMGVVTLTHQPPVRPTLPTVIPVYKMSHVPVSVAAVPQSRNLLPWEQVARGAVCASLLTHSAITGWHFHQWIALVITIFWWREVFHAE